MTEETILSRSTDSQGDEAKAIVEQVLADVQNSESLSEETALELAAVALRETLAASVIPSDQWETIIAWVSSTGIDRIYLDSRDRIGAWWASKELVNMGYALNFTKSGFVPSEWFPEGAHWKEAEVEARYRLVAAWEQMLHNGALEKIEHLETVAD